MAATYRSLGMRNNNPGNIKHNEGNRWVGLVGERKGFCVFRDMVSGLRAMFLLLDTYYRKYGLRSADAIIRRWCADPETVMRNYVDFVARELGTDARAELDLDDRDTFCTLVTAICVFECAGEHPSERDIKTAYEWAFFGK